jgi:competence protein ComEA
MRSATGKLEYYLLLERRADMNKRNRVCAIISAVVFIFTIYGAVWAENSEKININTATVDQLMELKRIGPAYAAKIVEFRDKNGPFKNPEDITKVPGIGPKTFEENKDRISVE